MRKYRNVPQVVDGIKFPSKKQARRYGELKLREKSGQIFNLTCERPFPLEVNGQRICIYIADFTYNEGKKYVVEDTKGVRTPAYRLKAKLMKACHGIEIFET